MAKKKKKVEAPNTLFWVPQPKKKRGGKAKILREPPPIRSKWKPLKPADWPNFRNAKTISIDCESYDPHLKTQGPGHARGDGHMIGFSASVGKDESFYLPFAHEVQTKRNVDKDKALLWAKDNLQEFTSNKRTVIGANLLYDIGWFREEGIFVGGKQLDVLDVDRLINENHQEYTLEAVANRHLQMGKESNELYEWLSAYYGGPVSGDQRKNMYRSPPALAGKYAESDAYLPFELWKVQKKIIKANGLEAALDLEQRLKPMLLDMRFRGVRVDLPKAEYVREELIREEAKLQQQLNKLAGVEVNAYAAASIAVAFDKHGLKYPYTQKTKQPSFVKAWLEAHPHKLAKLIVQVKGINKLRSTFIEGVILDKNVNGRIYCSFNPFGAKTGRFSSSKPNLQQIPSRHEIYAPLIRGCFIPDEGFEDWLRTDASQVEYRSFAHVAVGKSADSIRAKYRKDASTDYHQAIIELVHQQSGTLLGRKPAKNLNFALLFGAGKRKVCTMLGVDKKMGETLYNAYMKGAPFVKDSLEHYSDLAQENGYVQTINGRRRHFELWQDSKYSEENKTYKTYMDAIEDGVANPVRANTYKALNAVVQGSASVFMKKLMVDTYEAGVYDRLGGVPHLTVHDELNLSVNYKRDKKIIKEAIDIMEGSLKLSVPLKMDTEVGKNWGECEEVAL